MEFPCRVGKTYENSVETSWNPMVSRYKIGHFLHGIPWGLWDPYSAGWPWIETVYTCCCWLEAEETIISWMIRAEMTKRRHEVTQMSIAVTYDTPFRSGARTDRHRTSMTRLDTVVSHAIDSLAVGRSTGTKNDDQDKATIAILGNMLVIT